MAYSSRFFLRVVAEVLDAAGDVGDVVVPVVFVFDGDVALEAVLAHFIEDGGEVDDAFAENLIMRGTGDAGAVFHVEGMDARRDFFDDIERIQTRGGPVTEVSAEAEIGVAAFDGCHDGLRIPQRGGFGVIVEADFDVVFLGEFFQHIDGAEGLGADAVEAEGFGEFKDLPRLFFVVRNGDHAVVDDGDVVFFRMLLQGGDHLGRHVVAGFDFFVVGAEELSGENFHALRPGLGGFFDRFKEAELFQRPALHGDGEAGLGDDGGIEGLAPRAGGGGSGDGGKKRKEMAAIHKR